MTSPTRYDVERAVSESTLPPPQRHILLTLCTYMQRGSTAIPARYSPSLTRLTDATGWNRRTITRHLAHLETAGWLGRVKVPGKRTLYRVECPEPARDSEPPEVGADSPAARGAQTPIQTRPDLDPEIDLVITEIEKRTGRRPSTAVAAGVRDFILARPRDRDDPHSRAAYLRRTIAQDRDPSRFLPTPQPPRYTKEKGFA